MPQRTIYEQKFLLVKEIRTSIIIALELINVFVSNQWRGRRFCRGDGSQQGSGAEPHAGSRSRTAAGRGGGFPLPEAEGFLAEKRPNLPLY